MLPVETKLLRQNDRTVEAILLLEIELNESRELIALLEYSAAFFKAGNRQRGRELIYPELRSLPSSPGKIEAEADRAASAMLRIRLMPFNGISPLIMIPAVKDDLQMVMLCNDEQISQCLGGCGLLQFLLALTYHEEPSLCVQICRILSQLSFQNNEIGVIAMNSSNM